MSWAGRRTNPMRVAWSEYRLLLQCRMSGSSQSVFVVFATCCWRCDHKFLHNKIQQQIVKFFSRPLRLKRSRSTNSQQFSADHTMGNIIPIDPPWRGNSTFPFYHIWTKKWYLHISIIAPGMIRRSKNIYNTTQQIQFYFHQFHAFAFLECCDIMNTEYIFYQQQFNIGIHVLI